MTRSASPAAHRSTRRATFSRSSGKTNSSTRLPSISSGPYPSIRAMCWLTYVVRPSRPNDLGGPSIERLIPEPDSKILQQDQVGIDLAPGYEATLQIDQTPNPDDQLTKVGPLNQVFFQPGPGKAFEFWPAGQNCVVATFWKTEQGPTSAVNRSWCFSVL